MEWREMSSMDVHVSSECCKCICTRKRAQIKEETSPFGEGKCSTTKNMKTGTGALSKRT